MHCNQAQQQRWDAADAIFDTLLDLPPEQRQPNLDAMPGDATLKACVQRLLDAHAKHGSLDVAIITVDACDDGNAATASAALGRCYGDWKVEYELGHGGMSVVYAVVRGTPPHDQHAALKLLTPSALATHGVERLRQEHAILARLNHPHIAHLFDAGESEQGAPYLVMERVEGQRIDAWCDLQSCTVRERVQLMLVVCGAMAYAHRHLVVHADLKPSNVLVDDEGFVRVVDFGIGRLLDPLPYADPAASGLAMTPEYAAPEQHAGIAVTTATDVFGLGALFYRLLAGRPPCRRDSHAIDPPSQAASQRQHGRNMIDVDLDCIVLKALSPSPEQRHASADALAADLRAWLEHRPISARAPSRLYRTRKFVARHRIGVAATAAIAIAIMAGSATTVWQAQRAEQQTVRAVAVKDFLVNLLRRSDPGVVSGDPPASALLRRGAASIRHDLKQQPAVRAELLRVIGISQRARGLHDEARESLDAALALYASASVDDPVGHADTLAKRGRLAYSLGHYDQGIDMLRRADTMLQNMPEQAHTQALREHVRVGLAEVLMLTGKTDESRRLLQALIGHMRSSDRLDALDYSNALRIMGAATDIAGHPAQAIPWLRQAIATMDAQKDVPRLANVYNDLGLAYQHDGDLDQAETAFAMALSLFEQTYGAQSHRGHTVRRHLASVHLGQGRLATAQQELQALLDESLAKFADKPSRNTVLDHHWLSLTAHRAGDLAQATVHAQAAVTMAKRLGAAFLEHNDLLLPWLGLLRFEVDATNAKALLGAGFDNCAWASLADREHRMICLARAVQASDAGHCPTNNVPAAPFSAQQIGADLHWQVAYWLLRVRCSTTAEQQAAAANAIAELSPTANAPF
ncbi:MAG: serine/threonine-protein kinase, partial [Xanthomonadales bacterium]|nr:serine/threonine-protein kinase [Xanthomonadales bacterium]